MWQTVEREFWQRAQLRDLADARERFAHWVSHYNFFRPHQGIGGLVPADRFFGAEDTVGAAIETATDPATEPTTDLPTGLTASTLAPSAPASDGRTRRKKRTRFRVPDWKPRPVRALWESATDEDRERAHKTAMVMLEYWTAQLSKQEAAERLGFAPIRVWQLSQQAVCGMLAGLLTQPRDRYGKGSGEGAECDGRAERKRGRELKRLNAKLAASERLIEVMRELPVIRAARPSKEPAPKASSAPKKKRGGKRQDGRASGKPRGSGPRQVDR